MRKIPGINVDNVDKKVDNFYGKPGECRKYQYFSILSIKMLSDYVNSLMHKKNPHTLGERVCGRFGG